MTAKRTSSTAMAAILGLLLAVSSPSFATDTPKTASVPTATLAAAQSGDVMAEYQLAEIYFTGKGLPAPDYPKAKEWYAKAAEQGHGLSQLRLAFLNAENHFPGVNVDYKEAEKWFRKAADQNAGDARFRLGNFYQHYKTPPDYTQAVEWLTKAAQGGHRIAMFDLATLYREGKAIRKDTKKSMYWLEQAAKNGVMPAQITLAESYAKGVDTPKDALQSFIWAKRVADQKSAPVFWLNHTADILLDGKSEIPRNYPLALSYYERAAHKDDAHALWRAGQMYLNGYGTLKNTGKAMEYIKKASALGNAEAKAALTRQPPVIPRKPDVSPEEQDPAGSR